MLGTSTMETIYLLRHPMKKYPGKQKDLYMVFIDLQKAYDKVSKKALWRVIENKGVWICLYTKDRNHGVETHVRTCKGDTKAFPTAIELNQGLTVSPYFFALVRN